MSSDVVISVSMVSKRYEIYDRPAKRLWQMLFAGRRKFYREFWALRDVSFDIHRGESVGVIGRNGAGKSTLLKIITGTLMQTGGQVVRRSGLRVAALLELGSGFNPEFTGRENVFLNASVHGLSQKETERRYQEIVDFADIGDFIDQPVKKYSSGMKVRLAFAVQSLVQPDVLIVDEALAVGDMNFRRKCYEHIARLKKGGCSIFLVSHSMSDVILTCDRVIWLERGSVVDAGEPKIVAANYHQFMNSGCRKLPTAPASETVSSAANGQPDRKPSSALQWARPLASGRLVNNGSHKFVGFAFLDGNGKQVSAFSKPQKIEIKFKVITGVCIERPYVAFQVTNQKGYKVFASNNYVLGIEYPAFEEGKEIVASFKIDLPELKNDVYYVSAGINDGTLSSHKVAVSAWYGASFAFQSTSAFQRQDCLLKLPTARLNVKKR